MQLDKLVAYHKALADPTRIRMMILLASGETNGQTLAEKLHLSAPTVTHHAAKLREAALINERREKNAIYFSLNEYFIRSYSGAIYDLLYKQKQAGEEDIAVTERNDALKQSVLNNFFSKDGKLKQIPAQYKKKLIVLEWMASKLENGRKYAEKEINEFIKTYHDDFATIRREFIMHQMMYRENDIYELNPREMWTRWEEVK